METDRFVYGLVEETPAVDVHSHQGTNGLWQARSLWELFSYHWLATDIRCAGCPREVFTPGDMEPRDRMARAVSYAPLARNTVNHWCFMNMARDLYGFEHQVLDETNWQWLWEAVDEKVGDPQWETHVLDRARVSLVNAPHHHPARVPERYFPYEYGEYLFCPGLSGPAAECLRRIGEGISSAALLADAITARVDELVAQQGVRALHVWVPLTWTYAPVTEQQANALLHKALADAHLQVHERDQLASFAANCVAEACGSAGVVIQLFCGSIQMEDGGPHVSMYRPEWLRALVPLFAAHPDTNFELFLSTRPLGHEAAVLARNYPNLWVSGAWWQGFTPSTLSEFFRDRLEMLPLNKWNAFYSDAYCVEWIYGKVSLTRNRLAHALSEMLAEGLISRDMVEDLARAVMCDNARALYLRQP